MALHVLALLLLHIGWTTWATSDGHWESQGCISIPSNMALCQGLGYNTMRMPNLLGHESPAEAVQQSASWLPLLARECHPHARVFLCSLFAPVCLERVMSTPIQGALESSHSSLDWEEPFVESLVSSIYSCFRIIFPCRSLCEAVRDSCAPIMNCYGYPWPKILQCDQFPKDHLMCISSVTHMPNSTSNGRRPVPQASCMDCELEETTSHKELLELFCKSDFVVKVRLVQSNSSSSVLAKLSLSSRPEVFKHGPLLGGEMRNRLALWLEQDATCVGNLSRHYPQGATFLLTGTVIGERLLVNKAFSWSKHQRQLNQAARKWKRYRCRGQ